MITVDDTGSGICKEHLPYIFQNSYSTKGTDRGTGLYQVKTIVENLGGKITVEAIMVTAANDRESLEEAMHPGIVDYLVKPFPFDRFQMALEKFIIQHE